MIRLADHRPGASARNGHRPWRGVSRFAGVAAIPAKAICNRRDIP